MDLWHYYYISIMNTSYGTGRSGGELYMHIQNWIKFIFFLKVYFSVTCWLLLFPSPGNKTLQINPPSTSKSTSILSGIPWPNSSWHFCHQEQGVLICQRRLACVHLSTQLSPFSIGRLKLPSIYIKTIDSRHGPIIHHHGGLFIAFLWPNANTITTTYQRQ
jgi:hypothetical protein